MKAINSDLPPAIFALHLPGDFIELLSCESITRVYEPSSLIIVSARSGRFISSGNWANQCCQAKGAPAKGALRAPLAGGDWQDENGSSAGAIIEVIVPEET